MSEQTSARMDAGLSVCKTDKFYLVEKDDWAFLAKHKVDSANESLADYEEVIGLLCEEVARLQSRLESAEKANAQLADAAKCLGTVVTAVRSQIFGKTIVEYLHEQFPATVGHIPLDLYFQGLSEALRGEDMDCFVHVSELTALQSRNQSLEGVVRELVEILDGIHGHFGNTGCKFCDLLTKSKALLSEQSGKEAV